MIHSRRRVAIAVCLLGTCLAAEQGRADVAADLPNNVVIEKLGDFGELVFILYPGDNLARGFVIDPKTIPPGSEYQMPPSDRGSENTGPPVGKLTMIGIPRKLMEERKNKPDPKWHAEGVPGLVRISGVLHNTAVEKHSAMHRYRLEKTEKGLELKLMNPDVLTPYPAEDLSGSGAQRRWIEESSGVLQLVLLGILVLALVGVLVWRMKAKAGGAA